MPRVVGRRRPSLRTIYLGALTAVFAAALLLFVAFDVYSQREQATSSLLEEARVFAREMDAVWEFMDNAQWLINHDMTDGTYDFKGLHCAIVGKSVGTLFSQGNDYTIRYTNFNPRSYQGRPDAYEAQALTTLDEDRSTAEYYGYADYEGVTRFRYVRALQVNEGCLECHGEPVGTLDKTGHEREGWTLDSLGGAISIVIPLDQQAAAIRDNLVRDAAYFLLLTLLIGLVVYLVTSRFVLNPLSRVRRAFDEMRSGTLAVHVEEGRSAREIYLLIRQFNAMASELHGIYASLESQVSERTMSLRQANEALARQRDDLARLKDELEKEVQFKSDLLSMVNHELRTPLTSILTFAQIARERSGASGNETERRSWEEIEKNSQVLLGMINNMLDIARSDAGGIRAACEPMDLGDIVGSVRSTIAPLARRSSVTFSARVAPDVPLVMGDFEKTQRMIENLASNAVKFTPDGGSVQLSVTHDGATGSVRIVVSDTGIGIAPEDQLRIFDRFYQVDSTSTRRFSGSGLGLAIVREWADLQGFSVRVESELGAGSSFIIEIPPVSIVGDDADV